MSKFANRAQNTRKMANAYQDYLNNAKLLGNGAGGATAVPGATGEWLASRGNLAKTKLGQAVQGIGDTISYRNAIGKPVGGKVADLLKTKKGKLALGAGGGLLLGGLLSGGNASPDGTTDPEQMTDEELYNYIINGGY